VLEYWSAGVMACKRAVIARSDSDEAIS